MKLILLLLTLLHLLPAQAANVDVLTVRGAISPASTDYLMRGIKQAQTSARLVVIEMDTPGGLDTSMRAIAKQAEAERERRAKVIHAEGELQASEKLLAAAAVLSQNLQAMQLRYLQTLANIATDKTNTIAFPVPGNLMELLTQPKVSTEKS